ncbi:MAG: fused response regulator/phosphatase, partial [Pseudomonadota bacterium]
MSSRVLVADDNAVDRQLLSTIVKRAGYEVIAAVDGNDAVEKYYAENPDLVLLDALMPGKDGFAVAEEIKANSADKFVPIIFLTSLTEASELARCVEAGGDDFLSKPYNRVILQAKLSALQRMRDMHQTLQQQRDEISRHHLQLVTDQEAAKAVFDNVAHARHLNVSYIKHLLSPLAIFNGDVLLAAQNPSNNLYLMLGDFTGHGLAAAIGALPLSDVFYGMTAKGFSLAELVRECNRKLCSVLPSGYFCCAAALYIDFSRQTVEFWNGGLPSVYLRRHQAGEHQDSVVPLTSSHLPLGILSPDGFKD